VKETILDIRGLRKSFGSTEVLKSVDLAVGAGELVFVIGPSGSGKSTLLRCCNRLEQPDAGHLIIDGIDLMSPRADLQRLRQRIGMVFQQFNLYPHMRVIANVTLALRKVQRRPAAEAERMAMASLERVGLAHKARAYPGELSGGQQQRVAIARALALEPRIMLFDEPTSALDPELVGEVLQVMRDLRTAGVTMLVVSHEMRFARDAADRIVFMEHGEIIEQGTPEEILQSPPGSRARDFMADALA
jgi:polar amino acid transport system ATP-binding protein